MCPDCCMQILFYKSCRHSKHFKLKKKKIKLWHHHWKRRKFIANHTFDAIFLQVWLKFYAAFLFWHFQASPLIGSPEAVLPTSQERLEAVWNSLQMPDHLRLDMAIKYSSNEYADKLVEVWIFNNSFHVSKIPSYNFSV